MTSILALLMMLASPSGAQTLSTPPPEVTPVATPTGSPTPAPSPAGSVPPSISLDFAGNVSPQYALARITAAIAAGAQLQPGASADVSGITFSENLQPGTVLDALAQVRLRGSGTYADVEGVTQVHLSVEQLERLEPSVLWYSDDPETLTAAADGVAYRGTLTPSRAARLYLYHVSQTAGRKLYLVVKPASGSARVQVLGYSAGPTTDYGYAGHVATLRYLLERSTQESSIYDVSAAAPLTLPLGAHAFDPLDLIAAILDLRVLSGDAVAAEVIAASGGTDPVTLFAQPDMARDGHGRRGEFALDAVPPLELALAAGAPDPEPFEAGVPGLPNLEPDGRPLLGDYGVVRRVALQLSNPTATAQTLYMYVEPQGGSATTTIWFDGDAQPVEVPCVKNPVRYTVRSFDLDPQRTVTITGSYMTDGASSFPVLLGLTSTPPSPPPASGSPDGCGAST